METFFQLAKSNPNVLKYLPDERDWHRIDRQWLCNILFTIETEQLQSLIQNALEERQLRLAKKEHLDIEIRPEFAAAFDNCLQFASHKGKACSMLKNHSKRKRTRSEYEEIKEEEQLLHQDKIAYMQEAKKMKRDTYSKIEQQTPMRGAMYPASTNSMNQSREGYQMLDQSIVQAQFNI